MGPARVTLTNLRLDQEVTIFAGTIITLADRDDIQDLDDLRGKDFMAVQENSFGGWQMAGESCSNTVLNRLMT